jgi:transposase
MAAAFGDDLRRKFLSAYDEGGYTLEELAGVFMVSVGWAKMISAARTRSGRVERSSYQPGRKWRADAQAQQRVVAWVEAQPDLTLVEIQERLQTEAAVILSRGRVWYLLRKLGLRQKKSRSTPSSAARKPLASSAKISLLASGRSRRNA